MPKGFNHGHNCFLKDNVTPTGVKQGRVCGTKGAAPPPPPVGNVTVKLGVDLEPRSETAADKNYVSW